MALTQDQIALALGTYSALEVDSLDLRAHGAAGLYVTLHVKTAGTSTVAVRLQGKEPFEGTYYTLNVDATVTVASRWVWVFGPGAIKQPDGEAAATVTTNFKQFVGIPIPDVFRVQLAKGDTSDWVLGVTVRRIYG